MIVETDDFIPDEVLSDTLSMEQVMQILTLQQDILQMVAVQDASGQDSLDKLCALAEHLVPDALASVMLLNEKNSMDVRSSPSIPPEGVQMLCDLKPNACGGSCGNVIYRQKAQFVTCVSKDSRWDGLRDLANRFGLGACWSVPIRNAKQNIIGTFALTSFEERAPALFHLMILKICSNIAGIVLEREQAQQKFAEQERMLRLVAKAIDCAGEGIMITGANNKIIQVNNSFCQLLGYSADELLGKDPSMLKSGLHGRVFYESFWQTLKEYGVWSGEIYNKSKKGEPVVQWLTVNSVKSSNNEIENYVAVFTDMREIKEQELKLWKLSYQDSLTALSNRRYVFEHMDRLIRRAAEGRDQIALILLDIDRFKMLNDTHGHVIGDEVLKTVAKRLLSVASGTDLVGRMSGDEFIIIVENSVSEEKISEMISRCLSEISSPINIEHHKFVIKATAGAAIYPRDASSKEELLKHADSALHQAKKSGQPTAFYHQRMTEAVQKQMKIESELYEAIKNDQFVVYYQPRVSVKTGKICGAEALVRWMHPTLGLTQPDYFIDIAEESGLIIDIDRMVLQRACENFSSWSKGGIAPENLSVNISARNFEGKTIESLLEAVSATDMELSKLELELTETYLIQNPEIAGKLLKDIKEKDIQIALDDFGSGYASLGYLKLFSIDILKIDKSLISEMQQSENHLAIARSIAALGEQMNLKVIAEGAETFSQLEIIREMNVHEVQGYYYYKPMPARQLEEILGDC